MNASTLENNIPTSVKNKKVNKPKDSHFKQQKLKAWQPILTAWVVVPLMFAVGVSFIPLGIAFLIVNNRVQEKIIDYTDCISSNFPNMTCAEVIQNKTGISCQCNLQFQLTSDFPAPVYMYYSLRNFYQNHRRYMNSRDDNQLLGTFIPIANLQCDLYKSYIDPKTKIELQYVPCGAIANSLFNDSFILNYYDNRSTSVQVGLINTGIAWDTDINSKFKNPTDFFNSSSLGNVFTNSKQPAYWQKPINQLDLNNPNNNGFQNQDLMVWMRTSAFPTFRKFYRRINHTGTFSESLKAGNYSITINYNYGIKWFNGVKRFVLSTTSFMGSKNSFLGIAYLVVGCVSFLMGIVFLIIHIQYGKKFV